jgi:hypothetical protein
MEIASGPARPPASIREVGSGIVALERIAASAA